MLLQTLREAIVHRIFYWRCVSHTDHIFLCWIPTNHQKLGSIPRQIYHLIFSLLPRNGVGNRFHKQDSSIGQHKIDAWADFCYVVDRWRASRLICPDGRHLWVAKVPSGGRKLVTTTKLDLSKEYGYSLGLHTLGFVQSRAAGGSSTNLTIEQNVPWTFRSGWPRLSS